MRIFMFFYTVLMLAGSSFTLAMVPRALRDLGRERQRLGETLPGARFDQMIEAGYRMNSLLVLVEILFYYLLLRYTGPEWQFFYGGFFFGVLHILYLVAGRLERRRLKKGTRHTGMARAMIWFTALFTLAETVFLVWVAFLLTNPSHAAIA